MNNLRMIKTHAVLVLLAAALLPSLRASTAAAGEEKLKTMGIEFVRIPGGEFDMGSTDGDEDEIPVHRVRVSDFQIAKSEVTQAQWQSVMGNNPANFSGCDSCPVEKVSWNEAQEFIRKLSEQAGLALRLPTEAEWEYAAGGGAQHQKWAGTNTEGEVGDYSWYNGNAARKTNPICQKKPNAFGLCDMGGNVAEFCADWYGDYSSEPAVNPTGPATEFFRVTRGGSYYFNASRSRVADRVKRPPTYRADDLGLRLALPAALP